MSYVDFKNEEAVKEFIKNLYIEYKFGCFSEKDPEVCHLLGDYEEVINKDYKTAAQTYKKNCEELNSGRSCAKFGGYLFYGKGCQKDPEEAYNYFKKSCELNDGKGCGHYGVLSLNEEYNENRPDKKERLLNGVEALKKSCYNYKEEKACYALGSFFITGIKNQLEPDLKEAHKAMLVACECANPYACSNVSQMYARGEGVEKNEKLANHFKEKSIDFYNQLTGVSKGITFQQSS